MGEWIDRTAALERLGVKQQTLYAYVSRGQIGMMPDPADPRRSFYRADDVEGLRTRRSRLTSTRAPDGASGSDGGRAGPRAG